MSPLTGFTRENIYFHFRILNCFLNNIYEVIAKLILRATDRIFHVKRGIKSEHTQ